MPFYEPYPADKVQALREKLSDHLQARAGMARPSWENTKKENFPFRYPWKDIEPQLRALADRPGSPYDGVALEYMNPMTGGSTLATLSCWIQLLKPGEQTKKHRHTSSAVYFVVGGEGTTIVGEKALEWAKHDSFVIPNWAWHEHLNRSKTEEAILFSVNDIPIVSAFGLYREEPEKLPARDAGPGSPESRSCEWKERPGSPQPGLRLTNPQLSMSDPAGGESL